MARQPAEQIDLASARTYLTERGYDTTRLGDAQLIRRFRAVRKAVREGRPLPSVAETRGHPAKIQHLDKDAAKRLREHYFIERTKKQERDAATLRDLGLLDELAASPRLQFSSRDITRLIKEVGQKDIYHLVFRGYVTKYPNWNPSTDQELKFLEAGWNITREQLVAWLRDFPQENAVDLANRMAGGDPQENSFPNTRWVDISRVSIPIIEWIPKVENRFRFA